MRCLLDTLVLLWAVREPDKLSTKVKRLLDSEATLLFSVVSIWEILVKSKRGNLMKVDSSAWILKHMDALMLRALPLHPRHVLQLHDLPEHHQDPFDRMLICQALAEEIPIVTNDERIQQYPLEVIW